MKKRIFLLALVPLAICLARRSCAAVTSTVQTVPKVDLSRYAGVWYEIARYPNSFQRGCIGTTATYTLRKDGKLRVVNSCREEDGTLREAKAKAWSVSESNARLKVSFFLFMRGDYWIIDLDQEGYRYAVVCTPNRKLLWILSRTPQMKESEYQAILQRIKNQGFDPDRLLKTPQ